MPEVTVKIGGRDFEVACQAGEEHFLTAAAAMLDTEAQVLVSQLSHLTESRMLLMAGLMLADKTAGMGDSLKTAQARVAELEAELAAVKASPETVEVAVVPDSVTETLIELAARAEAMAAQIEEAAEAAS